MREADSGAGSSWFTPSRQALAQPGAGDQSGSEGTAFQARRTSLGSQGTGAGTYREQAFGGSPAQDFHDWKHQGEGFDRGHRGGYDRRDPGVPAGASGWREIPARGATAANRWAEVTRGGMPAGVNPIHRPDDDGFPSRGFPPSGWSQSGLSPNRRLPEGADGASRGDQWPAAGDRRGERRGGYGEAASGDIPFQGARPIDVSTPRNTPARRGPAYSAATAASAASGTARRRSETGALRKIRESGAIRAIMDTGAMRTLMDTTAMQMLRERYAGKGKIIAIVGACLWAVLAVAAILLVVMHGH